MNISCSSKEALSNASRTMVDIHVRYPVRRLLSKPKIIRCQAITVYVLHVANSSEAFATLPAK